MTPDEITKLKINYATMSEKIDNLSSTVCRIETKLDDYVKKDEARFELFRRELDSRYASKRIERIVDGLGWLVTVAVVGALLALVIR